jgi:hypothetical protein
MALIFCLYNFSYHNIVPTVLKAPEERYYGNIYYKTKVPSVQLAPLGPLFAVIIRTQPNIVTIMLLKYLYNIVKLSLMSNCAD